MGERLGGALAQASASGNAELRLALHLPLSQPDQSTVKGSVQLAGNDVRLRSDVPMLAQSRGRVDFTHKGLQVVGVTARALGGEFAFEGGTQPDGSLRFAGQGTATADGLRRTVELGGLAKLATFDAGAGRVSPATGLRQGPDRSARDQQPHWPGAEPAVAAGQDCRGVVAACASRPACSLTRPAASHRRAINCASSSAPSCRRCLCASSAKTDPACCAARSASTARCRLRCQAARRSPNSTTPSRSTPGTACSPTFAAGAPAAGADAGYLPRQLNRAGARSDRCRGAASPATCWSCNGSTRDGEDLWRMSLQSDQAAGHDRIPRSSAIPARAAQLNARLSRLSIPAADSALAARRREPSRLDGAGVDAGDGHGGR